MDAENVVHGLALQRICKFEAELAKVFSDDLMENEYHDARRACLNLLGELGHMDTHGLSLPDMIGEAILFPDKAAVRNAALIVTRMASRPKLLPEPTAANKLKIRVVQLFEAGLPDLAIKFKIGSNQQTYEKFDAISRIHTGMCERLEPLRAFPANASSVDLLIADRQPVLKAVGNELAGAYFGIYGQKRVRAAIHSMLANLERLVANTDSTFANELQELQTQISEELCWATAHPTEFSAHFYAPYLHAMSSALVKLEVDAEDRFRCTLRTKRAGSDIAEKRYPLHEIGRMIQVRVMLVNDGPGVARDVDASISCLSSALEFDPQIALGDIRPGELPLTLDVLIGGRAERAKFEVVLTWSTTGKAERSSCPFSFEIYAQKGDVDWEKQRAREPYSIEVAEGDEFVGRSNKVETISGRFMRDRMGSSFITGQKRIGKTSLAKAIAARLTDSSPDFEVSYLEYGQYSNMDPVITVRNLGAELASFCSAFLPDPARVNDLSFQGSLSPLSKLSDELFRVAPSKRFIFILDEFDEIDPALYRFGPLAEAFFSNLRTLSAKRNVAFLLVGGEKMPFVMSAQGDQLNKYLSERLDYFHRAQEWDDYTQLIERPVRGILHWDEAAIQKIFELTHGHPYYTKLICAKIHQKAVNERDTEITESDARHCLNLLVGELDSNAFAHLWKDGISVADSNQIEVFELNRRRVLCACARTLRASQPLTIDTVTSNRAGLQISQGDIQSTLMDFVRRGIFSERNGIYELVIPLFGRWLEEVGTSRLMADSLAEEYESKEQQAEEVSRVKSAEIVELTDKWSTYRGRKIGDESVRAWLEQVPSHREQRLLFKLLASLRFVSHMEMREKMSVAHNMVAQFLPTFYQERKSDRRRDVLITWVDGAGKSGNTVAGLYAEENRISTTCIVPPDAVGKTLDGAKGSPPAAVIVVDDFIGTGESLSTNLKAFVESLGTRLMDSDIRLLTVAALGTAKGERFLRERIARLGCTAELRIAEVLSKAHFAFDEASHLWCDSEERGRAYELCQRLGAKVHRQNPLGFGNLGLLLVFQDTCPNNTLPILHGRIPGADGWRPLFERPKN